MTGLRVRMAPGNVARSRGVAAAAANSSGASGSAVRARGAGGSIPAVLAACLLACSAGGGGGSVVSQAGNSGSSSTVDFGQGNLQPPVDFGDLGSSPGVDPDFTGIPECEACQDFPAAPIFEDGLGPEAEAAFSAASSGSGLCIIEPRDGMLIPANMLRPRVRFSGAGTLHQIRLHTPREVNDLVVYTTKNPWVVPPEIWQGLSRNVFEEDITVTVRSAMPGGAPSESSAKFRIAPVQAGGNMIYWAATGEQPGLTTTRLMAFGVGEEAVVTALQPSDVSETMLGDNAQIKRQEYGAPPGQARCIGCHTSTGDGQAVITADHWPWNLAVTDITGGNGGRPSDVTPLGALLLQMPWLGVSTTSRGDWETGARVLVTSAGPRPVMNAGFVPSADNPHLDMGFGGSQNQTGRDALVWIDMAAAGEVPVLDGQNDDKEVGRAMLDAFGTGWGVIAREGDVRGAVTPDWSHDGSTIAYTSTDSTSDGRVGNNANEVDIYTVPYAQGRGGVATPLAGASVPGVAEYYPDYSADDRYIAFNRVEQGRGRIYYHPQGEIYVVPATGGQATRLAANDPPACTGETSPGVTNSWPKWSPTVRGGPENSAHAGKLYYFLLFSSTRQAPRLPGITSGPASQLYLATIVQLPGGQLETYPAMYLWNQGFEITNATSDPPGVTPIQTSNLTPAFDEFVIPPRPPVVVR